MADGGGNMLCLDYRKSDVPTIVYYDSHPDIDGNYIYITNSLSDVAATAFIPEDVIKERKEQGLFLPENIERSK